MFARVESERVGVFVSPSFICTHLFFVDVYLLCISHRFHDILTSVPLFLECLHIFGSSMRVCVCVCIWKCRRVTYRRQTRSWYRQTDALAK